MVKLVLDYGGAVNRKMTLNDLLVNPLTRATTTCGCSFGIGSLTRRATNRFNLAGLGNYFAFSRALLSFLRHTLRTKRFRKSSAVQVTHMGEMTPFDILRTSFSVGSLRVLCWSSSVFVDWFLTYFCRVVAVSLSVSRRHSVLNKSRSN